MPRACVIYLAICLPFAAAAQSDLGKFEMTPYGAYSFGGNFTDTDDNVTVSMIDSAAFGLILDFRESANTQWEVIYSLQSTEAESTGIPNVSEPLDIDVHYLQLGGTYQGDTGKVRPYLAATVGGTYLDVKSDGFSSDTFFSFSIGPGLQINPNGRLGLRLEARVFGTFVRSGTTIFCESNPGGGSAGCVFTIAGDIFWQLQTMAGVVFRF